MKWGIVDYYQQKKISYDFVQKAYQPLLISMKLDKRRWLPGEIFKGTAWIVNDMHKEFTDCKLEIIISDSKGEKCFKKKTSILDKIPTNSSESYESISWKVTGWSFMGRFTSWPLDQNQKTDSKPG